MSHKHRKLSRVGKRSFGDGVRSHKTNSLVKDRVLRQIKRTMMADKLILDPATRPARYQFNWTFGDLSGQVFADDKSNARAFIKKSLGIPNKQRLPMMVDINRLHNPQYQQALSEIHANLQARA